MLICHHEHLYCHPERSEGSLVGSYHKLSTKHLGSYLDELEWRFNNRKNPHLFRDTLLKLIQAENLSYRETN